MPIFKIHTRMPKTDKRLIFYYDSLSSDLYDEDQKLVTYDIKENTDWSTHPSVFAVSATNPSRKDVVGMKRLKIKLGLSCNYNCAYCIQGHLDPIRPLPLSNFLSLIPDEAQPDSIEFWGGEPLLYWETIKPLAQAFRDRYPEVNFYTATNGSLLTYEMNEFIEKINMKVSISHDGPGQYLRGKDPLQDIKQRAIIFDLMRRIPKRFSFNAMVHALNPSRKNINDWFKKEIEQEMGVGFDFNIGEGAFISPKVPEHRRFCFTNYNDNIDWRRLALSEIRDNECPNMQYPKVKLGIMGACLCYNKPLRLYNARCGADREDNIVVDLAGNVFTCQNTSLGETSENGQVVNMGSLLEPNEIEVNAMTHWSYREECLNCPVLVLCLGGCPTGDTDLEVKQLNCEMLFSDNIPFFASAFEYITGFLPYYIEGPQSEDRKDIFGAVSTREEELID